MKQTISKIGRGTRTQAAFAGAAMLCALAFGVPAAAVSGLPAGHMAGRTSGRETSKPAKHTTPVASGRSEASATGTVGPADAPVTVVLFSDFACPYSASVFFTLEKLERRYPTQLRVITRQSPLPLHPGAPLAHRAALAAGRQGKFTQMAELLYANQNRQSEDALLGYARQLHLDPVRFRRDLDSAALAEIVKNDIEESHAFGVELTPTLYINGRQLTGAQSEEVLAGVIDKAALAVDAKASLPPPAAGEPALDSALLAALAANPAAEQGPSDAPLTIVEFTDFQCPYCRAAAQPLEQLMSMRGRDVRWEFRAFPLEFHADAEPAAEAALAAGAQGKFWPMHDLLFAHQSALKPENLRGYAQSLNLDMKAFDEALSTHRFAAQIAGDRALGARAGVTGTPTFLIGDRLITGALQLPQWNQLADAALKHGPRPARPASNGGQQALAVAEPAPVSRVISGPATGAPITLTWFTDVRSPLAARQAELVRRLTAQYGERMSVVFKAFPLATHADGDLAGAALAAAQAQGQFWPMFDALADRRDALDRGKILAVAQGMKLDPGRFARDLDEDAAAVREDEAEAARRGIQGAPVFFVNALRVDGLQREAFYTALADRELKSATASASTPAAAPAQPLP